jgi:hypothetical protein
VNKQGAIAQFESEEDAKEAGYKTKLSPKEAMVLQRLNRHERRAELARMRCQARAEFRTKKRGHRG